MICHAEAQWLYFPECMSKARYDKHLKSKIKLNIVITETSRAYNIAYIFITPYFSIHIYNPLL